MNWSISRHFSKDLIFERCRLGHAQLKQKEISTEIIGKIVKFQGQWFYKFKLFGLFPDLARAFPQDKLQLKFLPDK